MVRESKAKLAALDRVQAVIEFALDGTILAANANFLAAVGYELHEVVGHHHGLFVEPAHRDSAEYRAFWGGLRTGDFRAGQFRRLGKGGREVWIEASYNPMLGADGKPYKIVKFATDITRQKAQDADREGQIAAIRTSQAVIAFDLHGNILDANENFLRALGYALPEIVGRHHRLFLDSDTAESAEYAAFWEGLRAGRYQAGQFRRLAKGGREVWIEASYNPILDAGGRPYKVVKFATDVTAQKMQSADAAGQLAAINRSQAVVQFDPSGRILDANENFLKAVGYRLDEVRGQHHSLFVKPDYAESPDYAAFWESLRKGDFVAGMFQRYGRNGRIVWIQASYNPVFDPNGRLVKIVKYATDVSGNMVARKVAIDAAERTLGNVHEVTEAAEVMSVSAQAIARSMAQSKAVVDDIQGRAHEADVATTRLREAASAMGGVANAIGAIAQQINLLALNATIEAARAGAAGRGFSVVASEVKALAGQAAAATARIGAEITGMQAISGDVIGTLASITSGIGTISRHVDGVVTATDEQSRATGEILASMRQAAGGVSSISTSLDDWTVGMEERRRDRRIRVLIPARIHLADGTFAACTVRDISRDGAKLHLRDIRQAPDRFAMTMEDGRRYACEVRERAGPMLHVQFR